MSINANIESLIRGNRLEEACAALEEWVAKNTDDADALFELGRVYWRLGFRSKATTAYAMSAELEPGGRAELALEQAREIESFFNPDLLNP